MDSSLGPPSGYHPSGERQDGAVRSSAEEENRRYEVEQRGEELNLILQKGRKRETEPTNLSSPSPPEHKTMKMIEDEPNLYEDPVPEPDYRTSKHQISHACASSQSIDLPLDLRDVSPSATIRSLQRTLKHSLKKMSQCLFEGVAKAGQPTPLNQIYTELYITEGGSGDVNTEHEVRQIQTASRKPAREETPIKLEDILKPLPGQDKPIRTVITQGVAGIGKTVLTQKFTLDWSEDKTNQDIHFMFLLTIRELNLLKERRFSLEELLHHYFTKMKGAGICTFDDFQVLFILDGLDECRLPLDFQNNDGLTDITESTSVDVLLTNLIKGNLLPSAHVWITTRAANQIPPECVDRVTEVRGFTDPQKEEYFRKRFRDETQASRIISHIKRSRSLHIMCHIPVFCWITATVLDHVLTTDQTGEMPKTLTDMYIHFLVVQTKQGNVKYHERTVTDPHWNTENKEIILSLGKLAFEQLEKGNLIFYEADLAECGIDLTAASVYSGVFTKIFREECGLYQDKVFCFVHLSIQEFLAALHVFLSFVKTGAKLLLVSAHSLFCCAVDQVLQSENGHLELFLRFLLGLSLETNQNLLNGFLNESQPILHTHQKTVQYIKKKFSEDLSSGRIIYLFQCLNELKDHSLVEEIQLYLSGHFSTDSLSPGQWSALVFILLTSEEEQDVFDLRKYSASEDGLLRLLPVVKASNTALLRGCNLSARSCEVLASILSSNPSNLRELDLSNNDLRDSGVKLFCAGLESPQCRLEKIRLSGCLVTEAGCVSLASALRSNPSHLRELDLSFNHPGDSGVMLFSAGLEEPDWGLDTLRLKGCHLSERSCEVLASILSSKSSCLRELDLSNNDMRDSGVKLLCAGLESPHCTLENIRLSGCLITEAGCASLASALRSNPSHLRELDLSYNHPGDSGVKLLSAGLEEPDWRLDTLSVDHAGECRLKPGLRKYACKLTLDPNTVNYILSLSEDNRKVTWVEERQSYPDHPDRFISYCPQVLCREGLTGRCYWEVDWQRRVSIGVTYGGFSREGGDDSYLGYNKKSWVLDCHDKGYIARHNKIETHIPVSSSVSNRVGVYVDWPAGSLSFYTVSSDTLTHLHTFCCTFIQPLVPGFLVRYESSVALCHIE